MAVDTTPTTWLASWSEDGTTISVPIATFPELTATEADGTTGDIRKIIYAIADKMYNEYEALPDADQPEMMVIKKSSTFSGSTGLVLNTYSFKFYSTISVQDLADEV